MLGNGGSCSSATVAPSCAMTPDHDDGCGSPEPDLSAPHHLPEMDTDSPRYVQSACKLSLLLNPLTSKITNWVKLKDKQHYSKVLCNSFPMNGPVHRIKS